MSTYEELEKEFKDKVRVLQRKCDHKDLTDWLVLNWAIGHPTRFEVRRCNICNKDVYERTTCDTCGKIIEESEWITPDSIIKMKLPNIERDVIHLVPLNTYFCNIECFNKYSKKYKRYKR